MKFNINADELKVLAYLHENARGFTQLFCADSERAMVELKMSIPEFCKHLSYLVSHNLAGMNVQTTYEPDEVGGNAFNLGSVWLTGDGEDLSREIEQQPGVAQRFTVAAVQKLGKVILDAAAAAFVNRIIGP